MIRFIILFALYLQAGNLHAKDIGLGQEYIEPLHFPKFSITGEYEMNRQFHGFADQSLRMNLDRRFDASLAMETGLFPFLNAGVQFGSSIEGFKKPIHMRFGLFLKPLIPLGDRFSIFARVAGGLAVDLAFYPNAKSYYSSFDSGGSFDRVYKGQQYVGLPFGGYGSATAGLEFFPFSRVGLAIEFGIRAALLHNRRTMPFVSDPEVVRGAPSSFNFMLYEFPLMLTLHTII